MPMPRHVPLLLLTLIPLACGGDCPDPHELREAAAIAPGQVLTIEFGSGDLRIIGAERAPEVRLEASTCGAPAVAPFTDAAEGPTLRLDLPRPGTVDAEVRVPAGTAVRLAHRRGEAEVYGTGPLEVRHGQGRLVVEEIIGGVLIRDGGGPVYVRGVAGDVEVEDAGDALFVREVQGSLDVIDGSGGIYASDIAGDVVVYMDGTGAIEARHVGGDLRVEDKTRDLRLIRHDDVGGSVDLPASPP